MFYLSDVNGKNKDSYWSKVVIFINYSLCPYYLYLYGLVKDRKNEGNIDDFKIINNIIKLRETGSSNYISILQENDLWRPFFKGVFDNILLSYFFLFYNM